MKTGLVALFTVLALSHVAEAFWVFKVISGVMNIKKAYGYFGDLMEGQLQNTAYESIGTYKLGGANVYNLDPKWGVVSDNIPIYLMVSGPEYDKQVETSSKYKNKWKQWEDELDSIYPGAFYEKRVVLIDLPKKITQTRICNRKQQVKCCINAQAIYISYAQPGHNYWNEGELKKASIAARKSIDGCHCDDACPAN